MHTHGMSFYCDENLSLTCSWWCWCCGLSDGLLVCACVRVSQSRSWKASWRDCSASRASTCGCSRMEPSTAARTKTATTVSEALLKMQFTPSLNCNDSCMWMYTCALYTHIYTYNPCRELDYHYKADKFEGNYYKAECPRFCLWLCNRTHEMQM